MAELLTQLLISEVNDIPYENRREEYVAKAMGTDIPLSQAETWPEASHPNRDEVISCIYRCGLMAVELLVSQVGQNALTDFFTMLHPDNTWQETFQTAFGMSVDEFYREFEEHRATGFPTLRLPKTKLDEPPADPCIKSLEETGTHFTGYWYSTDCQSQNRTDDGTYYARFYSFSIDEAKEITITVTSEIDTYLYLLEGESIGGAVLHENDDHAMLLTPKPCAEVSGLDTTDSCITASLEAGDYTIEVTTYRSMDVGEFDINVEGLYGDTGTPPEPPEPPEPPIAGFEAAACNTDDFANANLDDFFNVGSRGPEFNDDPGYNGITALYQTQWRNEAIDGYILCKAFQYDSIHNARWYFLTYSTVMQRMGRNATVTILHHEQVFISSLIGDDMLALRFRYRDERDSGEIESTYTRVIFLNADTVTVTVVDYILQNDYAPIGVLEDIARSVASRIFGTSNAQSQSQSAQSHQSSELFGYGE